MLENINGAEHFAYTERHELSEDEIDGRLSRNRERLLKPYYQIPDVFQKPDATWPADKEGRALLAFVCHYKATGHVNPCMEELLRQLPKYTNAEFYFGPTAGDVIFEQQLSGHSWLLRGLCEHYEQFGDEFSIRVLRSVTEHLYLPTKGRYAGYPVKRDKKELESGGVSGHTVGMYDGWKLSTDVGCAFMSIDGLSHVYRITRDERVKELLDEMISVYSAIDKASLHAQTHCTLTAGRGMVRMYNVTGDKNYLEKAEAIFALYVSGGGMDAVYQNLNWWGRPNTWTEPCAIVDSLILAGELYRATENEDYRRYASRIFLNGFASAQREDGGAGTDLVVCNATDGFDGNNTLKLRTWEAQFCCSMRMAEGLWYAKKYKDMLYYETEHYEDGTPCVVKDKYGRYLCGDMVLAEQSIPTDATPTDWKMPDCYVTQDGHRLTPLAKFYKTPADVAKVLLQRVLF